MEKFYNVVGQVIKIDGEEERLIIEERGLKEFRCSGPFFDRRLCFRVVEKLSSEEGKCVYGDANKVVYRDNNKEIRYIGSADNLINDAYMRIQRQGTESMIEVRNNSIKGYIISKIILNAMEAEHFVIENNGIILHSSYIEWNNKAILFTAPSGNGKSTQADLWASHRQAEIINGDRAVIRRIDGKIFADGIPFSGSSIYCKNRTLPLAAIVYLEKAPVTTIQKMKGIRAFQSVWEGCTINTWDKEDVEKGISLVEKVIQSVPIYHLACTPDESAILALEAELNKAEQNNQQTKCRKEVSEL